MIPWRQLQLKNFTNWEKLAQFLNLDFPSASMFLKKPLFPLNLPLRLANKIEKNCLQDPILLQFLPLQEETKEKEEFKKDPLEEIEAQKTTRLLQKYSSRALLICTSACAMHCRYCFRQHYAYSSSSKEFLEEICWIQKELSLREIILSGGDPLSLSDAVLDQVLTDLDQIPHLKRVRFHTRFPVGIPERIDTSFLSLLKKRRVQIFFVLHVNHPKELDEDLFSAMKQIQALGIPTLNQTVLLRGVNDCFSILKELFESLVNQGILPYYLHQLDPVKGSTHFETSIEEGRKLMKELSHSLSGYAVPRYVKEEPGKYSKTPLYPQRP